MSSESLPAWNYDSLFEFTASEHPEWRYGQRVEDGTDNGKAWVANAQDFKVVDCATEDPANLYKLMISGIVPRPIAFVSTISEAGVGNLAPFSWFNMVSQKPPIISVSVSMNGSRLKDTASNIKSTKQFTVSIISEPFLQNANASSADAPEEIDEFELTGLTKADSIHVKPPRVLESAFSMECELYQFTDIPDPKSGATSCTLFLGLVKCIHVRKDVLNEKGLVDAAKFKAIGRMGDITYTRLGDGVRIPRPQWKIEGEMITDALRALE